MGSETSKARAGANGGALGTVECLAAFDVPRNGTRLAEIQAFFIARRFGVQPDRARLIADLAFARRRRA
jgi:hypothetical protein